jgi:Holliday junction DNA helicase RuvA
VRDLFTAIQAGDIERLATVPGIGKKSAARIALELKDKVAKLHPAGEPTGDGIGRSDNPLYEDALSALVNLGYRQPDVKEVLKRVEKSGVMTQGLEQVIREALKDLAKG